jgi:N-glycosylase/DNA lyase
MQITIPVPREFNYKRTLYSHGWYSLAPFAIDESKHELARVLDIGSAQPITVSIAGTKRALVVTFQKNPGKRAVERITRDVRHIFRLDDDMSEFYCEVASDPDFAWLKKQGAGRMLRSPTVWEDLVKSLATTNCSWSLTEAMVNGLVNKLGRESSDGRRQFPTAEAMASMSEKFYRDEIRAGYRSPYFKELAERVVEGDLDVESWLTSDLPTDLLKKEMKRVKGVGDYAAENLLKLVGRYDVLALDSWIRAKFAKTHNNGRKASDKRIAKHYARFNTWRGLALWCDMTKDWL